MRFAIALILAGCTTTSTNGKEIFANACTRCHGPTGKPTAAMVATQGVHDLTAPEFRKKVTVELVDHQIHWGSKNKLMPGFDGALSDEQIAAVAAYVASPSFGQ